MSIARTQHVSMQHSSHMHYKIQKVPPCVHCVTWKNWEWPGDKAVCTIQQANIIYRLQTNLYLREAHVLYINYYFTAQRDISNNTLVLDRRIS